MEAVQKRYPSSSFEGFKRFVATRKGAAIVAGGIALLAGAVLIVFLQQYRSSVTAGTESKTVLRADNFIPKGTSGAVAVSDKFLRPATLSSDQVASGAIADAAALKGKVATRDIYPGQQLTAKDFVAGADPLRGQLNPTQRAIAVPVDQAHGLLGNIRDGDHVDVIAAFNGVNGSTGRGAPIVRTLAQDVLVLKVPAQASGSGVSSGQNSSVVLRISEQQAAQLAFASDNGKVWFALRTPAGAKQSAPETVNLNSLLVGTRPIEVTATKSGNSVTIKSSQGGGQ